MNREKPSLKSLVGMLLLILLLALYAFLAAAVGELLANSAEIVRLAYYGIAGIAWIVPARYMFVWIIKR